MIYGVQYSRNRKCGFTLAELLISLTIFSVFMTGLFSLFFYGANRASDGVGKLLINRDIRKFTNEMTENARFSDFFEIYKSFTNRDQQYDGGSGDFLVLTHRDPANKGNIGRIVGYYRYAEQDGSEGPVLMFDQSYNPSSTEELADLLPAISSAGSHEEVIELSNGLSDGKLFYNFYDRSIIVRGEILHDGAIAQQVTNTYNFTISPRG
ncbi:MAG: prepilin-type N-terminal cleavage/methylation domain-containing protein [Opitutales bacterium]|jgi:prepilin-type N-terminal cleavage/methylation domain-containing protein|nr:prepilin-type N-terminal cleavage/methylation domain-containing protein [Opitutales bacterium]MBT5814840.1 prepilin-type N-terminal cleavage/methylation domain-containing protein [Opitutales bacterium]MBT6380570.1 prepilin-type N-terminal cleavage/methylation domain-containing protein [Opitutales bacterium]